MHPLFLALFTTLSVQPLGAQCDRWQQEFACTLRVVLDVRDHRFNGTEQLTYVNNSPDTLRELYFHLYFNAFRPGSEMDIRSRTIADPDPRVGSRIAALAPHEQGELRCSDLRQDGAPGRLEHMGTIMRAILPKPIFPGASSVIELTFAGQVPVQIRRSGRDNREGVAYSMTQWYPKVAAYDDRGWHTDPYVGREFYGEWGSYDLFITLDSAYTVACTGVLMNPGEAGHGYAPRTVPVRNGRITWHFRADQVHDVAWAADKDYMHTTAQVPDGPLLRFFHKAGSGLDSVWAQLPAYMVKAFQFMNTGFGKYPWPEYVIAQGGDGGMEYPMLTLITGQRRLGSLVGVSVHESVHSWYYGVLANDEGHYPWMDEGATEYAGSKVMAHLFGEEGDPHTAAYDGYRTLVPYKDHEPMSVHGDHFLTNRAYGVTAYNKGEMLLHQLGVVIGDATLRKGLLRYYDACAFKHPRPVDLELSMEKASGLQLDWYFDQWMNTTRLLDLAIGRVEEAGDSTVIVIERRGDMVMPVDLEVVTRDGRTRIVHIPISLTLGSKQTGSDIQPFEVMPTWPWTAPIYRLALPGRLERWSSFRLDPAQRLADMDRENDAYLVSPVEPAKGRRKK